MVYVPAFWFENSKNTIYVNRINKLAIVKHLAKYTAVNKFLKSIISLPQQPLSGNIKAARKPWVNKYIDPYGRIIPKDANRDMLLLKFKPLVDKKYYSSEDIEYLVSFAFAFGKTPPPKVKMSPRNKVLAQNTLWYFVYEIFKVHRHSKFEARDWAKKIIIEGFGYLSQFKTLEENLEYIIGNWSHISSEPL